MGEEEGLRQNREENKPCVEILRRLGIGGDIGAGVTGRDPDHVEPDPDTKTEELHFFGIDAETGRPLTAPTSSFAALARAEVERVEPEEIVKAERRARALATRKDRGLPPGNVDAQDLASAGWGVIFAAGVAEEVKEALAPLLRLRKAQAGCRFKEFDNLSPATRASDWLYDLNVPWGPGNVNKVPYYLMVVGDPKSLPFGFEFDLVVSSYAVGRIAFDTPDEYERFARNVVEAEQARPRSRRLAITGMHHEDDITCLSRHYLTEPVARALSSVGGWDVVTTYGDEADKARVASFLGGSETPAIYFHAGHGVFGSGHVGSLLCAGYPGSRAWDNKPLPNDWIFSHRDLDDSADLRGLVAILFGCYTAGVPENDTFAPAGMGRLENPAMASLASRLLSHPRGASAVLGHVDRAWVDSFLWRSESERPVAKPQVFESVLRALLAGQPIGAASAYLHSNYHAMSKEANDLKRRLLQGELIDTKRFTRAWRAERDARSYLIYGDPAARPAVA